MNKRVRKQTGVRTRAGLRIFFVVCAAAVCALCLPPVSRGQAASGQPAAQTVQVGRGARAHLIGAVTAVDAASGQITIRTDAGAIVSVSTNGKTSYLRLAPGETKLERATPITRADVRAGDRVLVPGGAAADAQVTPAHQVIVTSAAAADGSRAGRESEEARARRVIGRVTRLDPARKEIAVQARTREGLEEIVIDASGNVRFLRFAPDSIRPADARQGLFAELKVGDQLRATGERAGDPTHFRAEEIISGTFARIGGKVSAVDAGRGEVSVKSEETGENFTVAVGRRRVTRCSSPVRPGRTLRA
ncbi:MAG: hypothetical protein LC774_17330 [Acidobacteria bacterium]|nr:hypothetical protein [Acidobacteriota bacterium]